MIKQFFMWIQSSFRRSSSFNIIFVISFLLIIFNIVVSQIIRHYYEDVFLEKGRIMAISGAASIQQIFEHAISHGTMTQEDLFDTQYQPIEGTDPQKYTTKYDLFAEENIVQIEDAYLQDHDISFAIAVDINGYSPAHNSIYSQELTGDYDTDLVANRTRRIFDDATGIAAARNLEPYLLQVYERDTGEIMWDISAPIFVYGEHWGAFRIGLSTIKVNAHIDKLRNWIVFITIFIGVFLLVISYVGSKPIDNIIELSQIARKISYGDLSARSVIQRSDEIGLLSDSLNMIIDSQQGLAREAAKIADGDFSSDIVIRSDKDIVSQAFSRMVDNLCESLDSLQKERNLLQTLLDNSVDMIYFKDLQSRFLRISRSQAIRFGLQNVEDAVGKSDSDFFAKEHAEPAYEDEQNVIKTKRPILYKEEQEIWPNGDSNWVITSKLPLYNSNKEIIGTFGISRDITSRKKMEGRLLQNQEKMKNEIEQRKTMEKLLDTEKEILSTTLMSISEGVIATDTEGFITFVNHKSEELTGYSASESLDQPIAEILKVLTQKSEEAQHEIIPLFYEIEKAKKNSAKYSMPTLLNKNGTKLVINVNIATINAKSGETIGHVIVFDDITELQEKETQTALSQKMESIGQMASGIAHEINTPIQYVGDNIRYLQRAFSQITEILLKQKDVLLACPHQCEIGKKVETLTITPEFKKIQWYMDEVPVAIDDSLAGVDRVRKIVLAMREFSHPSGDDKTFSNINTGIETTVTISRNEWKYVADMELDLKEDLPLVNCYLDEINQVVLNMVVNAAHAIKEVVEKNPEERGKITIKTDCDEKSVFISIQDSGVGIPENIKDRVFDPFFTTKGIGKGTGQGLFLAHNVIVNKHGGQIKVVSEQGQGTTFIISIPIDVSGELKNESG